MADARNIMIMIVNHLRKSKPVDPFDMLYGSDAIPGAADVIWFLQRERGNYHAERIVSGRDVPDQTPPLKLSETCLTWTVIDPITAGLLCREVFEILWNNGGEMSLDEISDASGFKKPVLSK
jgi:hypothetical protein